MDGGSGENLTGKIWNEASNFVLEDPDFSSKRSLIALFESY